MEVHRNLRTKVGSNRMRMVRIVGDGTPENTRILDRSGKPLEELVISYSIQGDGEGCARGVFTHYDIDESGDMLFDSASNKPIERTFEAWVMFEKQVDLTRESQLERLAAFIIEHVPGEPSEDEGAVDTAIRLLRNLVEVPVEGEHYWSCKIGPVGDELFNAELSGQDSRLREMVQDTFYAMFDKDADEVISGWSAHLTQGERRAAENYQDGTPRGSKKEEGFDVGGIGTPTGPPIDAADLEKLPFPASAEDIKAIRDGGGWEAPVTQEELEALRGESGETAFSRLAPGAASKDTI